MERKVYSANEVPCQYHPAEKLNDKLRILVHGGAWDIPQLQHAAHLDGVKTAYGIALDAFNAGCDGMEIVLKVLDYLEEDPTFDAGKGSFLNECGEVELDAAVMEGKSLLAGAVAGVRNFLHPGRIAHDVMTKTHHAFLISEGAEAFAQKCGHVPLHPDELVDPREREVFARWLEAGKPDPKIFFASPEAGSIRAGAHPDKRGTVGVVVGLRSPNDDSQWNLFAGTSTGGTAGKMRGRVGDVPIIGAGVYADDEGAAISCTGWGEGLMRIAAGQRVSGAVRAGVPLQQAVEDTLSDMKRRMDGYGGIIAIDRFGNMAASYTTPFMAYAGNADCISHLL